MATAGAQTAKQVAAIAVSSGPDRGAVYRLTEEMVHIGRGADRQVVLTDPEIADLHASIACRNGRYALYAPADGVLLDDTAVPAERWVWLPENARIRLTASTSLQFTIHAVLASSEPADEADAPAKTATFKSPRAKSAGAKSAGRTSRAAGRKSTVARFITDQQGDTLVKLGEDGHLPELALAEGPQAGKPAEQARSGGNPLVMFGAMALSVALSAALLLVDFEPSHHSQSDRAGARHEITGFYGVPGESLRPYQRLLREAQLAYARRDYRTEVQAYRDVLAMLNSEDYNHPADPTRTAALTGDPKRDQRLRELIAVLISR